MAILKTEPTAWAHERPPRTPGSGAIRVLAYPALLGAVVVVSVLSVRRDWDPATVSMLFLLGTVTYLLCLERVVPYDRSWHPQGREWGVFALYFVLSMTGGALAQLPVYAVVGVLAPAEPSLPLGLEIVGGLLVGSLASYVIHRLGHAVPLLWRLHGVHHVPKKVNVATNGVNHVADVVISQFFVQVVLSLLGISADSVLVIGLFVIAQGYFVHANIDVRMGALTYVLAGPEVHRLHHSIDLSEAGHFGSDLVIWDLLFGSFTWAPGRAPAAVGVLDQASFPPTNAVLATLASPWRHRATDRPAR